MKDNVNCNLCGSPEYSVLYETRLGDGVSDEKEYRITDHAAGMPVRIVRCGQCGLIYANPRPSLRDLISSYTNMVDNEYVEEEEGRRLSARPILEQLKKMGRHGHILDFGCATGFLLDEARKAGWEVYGIELSAWAVEYAKNKFGIDTIFHGVLKNADYPDRYFDAVVMKDSIEHLPDPKDTLVEIRRILKPDGVLCINTPNIDSFISKALSARWWGVKQSHLYYFSRRTLYAMLRAAGFEPVKTKSHVRVFTMKYWISRLRGYSDKLLKVFTFLVKYGIMRDGLIRVDMKDQIDVYAVPAGGQNL